MLSYTPPGLESARLTLIGICLVLMTGGIVACGDRPVSNPSASVPPAIPSPTPDAESSDAAGSSAPDLIPNSNSSTVSVASLADAENYLICSQPLLDQVNVEDLGYCFAFRKNGDRLSGYYYDTKTYGEVGLCITGTISGNTLNGQGIEFIGSIGRQSTPPGSEGQEPVNWDQDGYLKVARAEVLRSSSSIGKEVRYNTAVLTFDYFYRHPDMENAVSARCAES